MNLHIQPPSQTTGDGGFSDLMAAAEVFDDTETLAIELEVRSEHMGAGNACVMRDAADHMRGMHALLLQAVAQARPSSAADRLISMQEVTQLVSLRPSSVYAMVKAGTFPAGVKTGARLVRWSEAAVQAWIQARLSSVAA